MKDYISKTNPSRNTLAIFQFGDNSSSNAYIKGKIKDCEEMGLKTILYKFPEFMKYNDALQELIKIQDNPYIAGVIIQLPIPYHLSHLPCHIKPELDVDGFLQNTKFIPATPKGIIELLDN